MEWQEYLESIYYDPENAGSFSGPDKLYRYVQRQGKFDISKNNIEKWLLRQESYSLQRGIKRRFKRNKIMVTGIDDQWSMDLMDMGKYAEYNEGCSYILVVIDTFSKYLWLRPLKDKKGISVKNALYDIIAGGRKPNRIRSDKGQEFRARIVQSLLKENGIQQLFAQNETKASISERVIKTIKSRIARYMTHNRTYVYLNQLQSFAKSYNETFHRTIQMAPTDVNEQNETAVWWKMYWPKKQKKTVKKPFKFKVGDRVRLSHLRNPFTREYDQKWTGEIFSIAQKIRRGGLVVYRIKDYDGDAIEGTFYQPELQKLDIPENEM